MVEPTPHTNAVEYENENKKVKNTHTHTHTHNFEREHFSKANDHSRDVF
jgi:hypothetical protein